MTIKRLTIFALFLLSAFSATLSHAQTPLKPGATEGATLNAPNIRNYAECEFYVGIGTPGPSMELEIYNTTGTTGPDGACPADKFAAVDTKKLAGELGASVLVLNPPVQTARKWWIMDKLVMFASGETYGFSGIKATWVGKMSAHDLEQAAQASKVPYQALTNQQLSTWTYNAGKPVFLLRAPEGKVYVMQAVTNMVDKDMSYDQLPQLASKLKKLPPGWTYEMKTLTKELVFDVRKATPSGLKHLTLDEYGNVYLGCGFDTACNYVP